MSKLPRKAGVRAFGSVKNSRHGGQAGVRFAHTNSSGKWVERDTKTGVFIGPSVEGVDKEYVKVISGKVTDRKPTFAR
ncbi:MAG TPA: hypothetical protein VMS09_12695 [Paenibacillus sp.]|uniref:hypothetical protein n=1 Tax=Paenibacillus sp. TaxID=58172 RepID=UPI0028D71286|nr:hypothetical protein [Paenibacillus sp.]HUC92860.1 hypothetical protein [Paenibacillus sp.]